jgi:hypothetical protein
MQRFVFEIKEAADGSLFYFKKSVSLQSNIIYSFHETFSEVWGCYFVGNQCVA